jgi:Cu/Ag efflux protein CusF
MKGCLCVKSRERKVPMRKIMKLDKAMVLFSVIVVTVAAALLLTSFSAYAGSQMSPITRQAEVLGVDHATQRLTVRLLEGKDLEGDDLTISIDQKTRVMFCTEPTGLDALKRGDIVTITYSENLDGIYADSISLEFKDIAIAPDAAAC